MVMHHARGGLSPLQRRQFWLVIALIFFVGASLQLQLWGLGSGPAMMGKSQRRLLVDVQQQAANIQAPSLSSQRVQRQDAVEIWARPLQKGSQLADTIVRALGDKLATELESLCGRCIYRTLNNYVRLTGAPYQPFTLVLTGDIPAMWIRDSEVQISSLLPRVRKHPALRGVVEGAIRAQAFFLLQDPWANAFNISYIEPLQLPKQDRQLGRGGWVWTRNFELDSIGYFYNLLHNYYHTDSIWEPNVLLSEPAVHDAIMTTLNVLAIEQEHETRSPYRYCELSREGKGPETQVTGMIWSAFRASDDPQVYSYHIPDNMYVAGALERLLQLNDAVWRDEEITRQASKLAMDIRQGIERYGIITLPGTGGRVYAYEVDGRGNHLVDFDDPNVPSLLAMPLLGYKHYDEQVYLNTRQRILSTANSYYVQGQQLTGLGSPHTPGRYVWPIATAVQALTSNSTDEQVKMLSQLAMMAAGNGLMHESVNADQTAYFTRAEFGWANALLVTAVEQLLGIDCDAVAERARLKQVADREHTSTSQVLRVGGPDKPEYYEQLESGIRYVVPQVDQRV